MDLASRVTVVTGGASGIGVGGEGYLKTEDPERWLRGMRRVQQQLESMGDTNL